MLVCLSGSVEACECGCCHAVGVFNTARFVVFDILIALNFMLGCAGGPRSPRSLYQNTTHTHTYKNMQRERERHTNSHRQRAPQFDNFMLCSGPQVKFPFELLSNSIMNCFCGLTREIYIEAVSKVAYMPCNAKRQRRQWERDSNRERKDVRGAGISSRLFICER